MNSAPTADELAGMASWNNLSEPQREDALRAAGWKSGAVEAPSVADAWAYHKKAARSMPQP
jgi:hypothetical protein